MIPALPAFLSTPVWSFSIAALLIAGFGAVTALLLQLAWNKTDRAQKRDAQSRRLLSALDNGPPWLLFLDTQGQVLQANTAFAGAFGVKAHSLTGQRASAVLAKFGADPALLVRLDAARLAGQGFRLPLALPTLAQRWLLIGQPWTSDDKTSGYWLLGVDLTEERTEADRLHNLAYHDSATGLPNRAWLLDRPLAQPPRLVIYLSFPRLPSIIATLGRDQAELFMADAARRLEGALSPTQQAARLDTTSFALIDSGTGTQEQIRELADSLAEPFMLAGHEIRLLPAIGIVKLTGQESDLDLGATLADAALAASSLRVRQRAQIAVYNPDLRAAQQQQRILAAELRRAIYFAPEQLSAAYQPICRLADGKLVGVELLARWEHPTYGAIKPGVFIPIAEDAGLIGALSVQLFAAGCRCLRAWHHAHPDLFLSVNLSARQLDGGGLLKIADVILEMTGLQAGAIKLELTETGLMEDVDGALQQLQALRTRGFQLSVDDFGTSFTKLAELHRLPLTDVKIDRSFVAGIHNSLAGRELAAMMARLGIALGHTVTADGIATAADAELLRSLGCQLGQGQLFGTAVAAEAMSARLAAVVASPETV